jgi:hypothetical protein
MSATMLVCNAQTSTNNCQNAGDSCALQGAASGTMGVCVATTTTTMSNDDPNYNNGPTATTTILVCSEADVQPQGCQAVDDTCTLSNNDAGVCVEKQNELVCEAVEW